MPTITSRARVSIPVALLLGLITVVSGAAEQHDPPHFNITHNSPWEGPRGESKGELCLVGSRNCLSMNRRHPPRLCLAAPQRCEGDVGRLERLEGHR
jgi:hypothetical protein